jgi:class 3 adenylate cyclase
VWHVLSHTDRLNRHVGLTPVTYGDVSADESGFFRAAGAKVAGIALKWREYPFEWENDGRYSVVRLYDGGPIERFEGGIKLEDAGQGATKLTVFSDMIGRGALGQAMLPLIARPFLQKTLEFCDKYLSGTERDPQPRGPRPKAGAVDAALLQRLILDLKKRPIGEKYAEALADLLRDGGDGEVAQLRPFEWAKGANLEQHEALRTCLHAVRVGLLDLRWAMMCPNCRVSKAESTHLNGLADAVHCDVCGVGYDLNFDRYVELRFAVHPAVRRANFDVFCLSGPFATPHILVQKCIDPGEIASFPFVSSEQTLRLRVLRSNQNIEIAPGALLRPHFRFDGQSWDAARAREGQELGVLAIENDTREVVCVALEKTDWDELAVTAARVTMLQEFRDLFSSQVLRPGRQVAVENVTLFFSDLSNSTSLYESMGDAPAFGRVGSHFDFLTQHIARNHGAVVKTMGDAVMAVFHSPEDAVRAAFEIQRDFRYFSDSLSNDGELGLKIGLHHGPALVVNSNDRLDYFGRTVNIASRVAGASRQGDFVLTGEVWEFSSVQRLLIEAQVTLSRFEANLRGVEQTFALVRVRV